MNLPTRFKERMYEMLGDEAEDFFSALDTAPIHTGIRINSQKTGARELVLSALGNPPPVKWCKDGFYTAKTEINGAHPYHTGGLLYFQEPSAMAAVEAIPIKMGDYVLDLCAAPGGKSTQAAAKLNGTGILVSNEIVKRRAEILSENIERMGIKNAVVTNETPLRLAEKFPRFFDKIIVDAPCSGEGMFRKEPKAVQEWSEEHTISCGERQKNILDSAAQMLRGGGYMVYSTCTFSPDENERVIDYLLDNHNLELCDIKSLNMLSDGIKKYSKYDCIVRAKRIFPHKNDGEGHFIALLKSLDAPNPREEIKAKSLDNRLYREFEKKFLNITLDGGFAEFGDNLYLLPCGIDINRVKVLRAGLYLGVLKKDRFLPSLSLALALKREHFKNTLECDFDTAHKYLMGEVIPCGLQGWCAVTYNGFPLGWGKASGGVLKNHYPKHLRLKK